MIHQIDAGLATLKSDPTGVPDPPVPLAQGRNHYEYCYAGYQSSGIPARDVLRLGAMCGPSNGLLAAESVKSGELKSGPVRSRVRVAAGACLRLVAASTDAKLEVELIHADRILASCELEPLGWCPKTGPVCLDSTRLQTPATTIEWVVRALDETANGPDTVPRQRAVRDVAAYGAQLWDRPRLSPQPWPWP